MSNFDKTVVDQMLWDYHNDELAKPLENVKALEACLRGPAELLGATLDAMPVGVRRLAESVAARENVEECVRQLLLPVRSGAKEKTDALVAWALSVRRRRHVQVDVGQPEDPAAGEGGGA